MTSPRLFTGWLSQRVGVYPNAGQSPRYRSQPVGGASALPWNPPIVLRQSEQIFRVGATDAEAADDERNCSLGLALKVRPRTIPETGDWVKRSDHFILGVLVEAIKAVNGRLLSGLDLGTAVQKSMTMLNQEQHSGVRNFLRHALDCYFQYHEAREEELGQLYLIDTFPGFDKGRGARLTAWGALYESANGDREMRRLRYGATRETVTAWAYVAAHVAAETRGRYAPRRIWVTEISLESGMERHVIQGISPVEAAGLYQLHGRPAVLAATAGIEAKPGLNCSTCKLTGACRALVPAPRFMQADTVGPWTRSVSALDLDRYERCASQWYMERAAHLPQRWEGNEPQLRGSSVHQWLAAAHERGIACTPADLPVPGEGEPVVGGQSLDETGYALAYPYLLSHLQCCPLSEALEIVAFEKTLYAYDGESDVVLATKADAIWRRGDALVIHEVKTIQGHLSDDIDSDAIFDRFFAIAWDLVALDQAFVSYFHAARGQVQLEVLSPGGGRVFTFDTGDADLMKMARGRLGRLARAWLVDTRWAPTPYAGCPTCSVRRWCDLRDQWTERPSAPSSTQMAAPSDDTPPF